MTEALTIIKMQSLTLKYVHVQALFYTHASALIPTHSPHIRFMKTCNLYHLYSYLIFQSQIMFYNDCVQSFVSSHPREELGRVHAGVLRHLEETAELVVLGTGNARTKTVLGALLALHVHCRDIVGDLLLKSIFRAEDFEWTR